MTPAIERPNRGDPRRRAIDLPTEVIKDLHVELAEDGVLTVDPLPDPL